VISNERPSPFNRRPYQGQAYGHPQYGQPKPPVPEDTIKSVEIQVERKIFVFALKENVRGRFLRITEDAGGKHNTIIIPATGLEDFNRVVNEMVKALEAAPVKNEPAGEDDSVGNR
jgi:hypothetical protein